jgi:hypothetical protein
VSSSLRRGDAEARNSMMKLWQAAQVPPARLPARLDLMGACGILKPRPDKVRMHFDFDFSASQILWTLTFAALLVLLVVLLGRDRAKRFPWFTADIAMMGLLLLTTQLLLDRMSRLSGTAIFLAISDLNVAISLLVLIEVARQSFRGAKRLGWIVCTLVMLASGVAVLASWGPWPAWKTLTASSQLVTIRLMDLAVDKGMLFSGVLTIELGLLVTLLGRRFGAGWRSHAQRIAIGLSTAALAQMALRAGLEAIGSHSQIHTQAEYEKLLGLRQKMIHANNVVYLGVLLWWIASLWMDEPAEPADALDAEPEEETVSEAKAEAAEEADQTEARADKKGEAEPPESPEGAENAEPNDEGSDPDVHI